MGILKTSIALLLALAGSAAHAQSYPARNVVFISSAAGGASEAYMRAILDKAKQNTGATLVFEPRPGGGGAPALQALKNAAPDGYAFGITFASAMNLNPQLNKDLGIDPLKDFMTVTNLMLISNVVAVGASFPAKDVRDLVAAAKANPGKIRMGVFSAGSMVWHRTFEERAGVKFLAVPFKTTGEAVAAVLGGHIDGYYDSVGNLAAQRGKLKALANGAPGPSPLLPAGVPLMRDLFNFDMLSWFGVIAPAGTPASAVGWMGRELARAVRDPKVKEPIEAAGFSVVGDAPEEFARMLRAEIEANAEIVRKYPDIR